jgi:hypothetical protein
MDDDGCDRLISYVMWSFGPGYDSYYAYMLIDTSKPIDQVKEKQCFAILSSKVPLVLHYCVNITFMHEPVEVQL